MRKLYYTIIETEGRIVGNTGMSAVSEALPEPGYYPPHGADRDLGPEPLMEVVEGYLGKYLIAADLESCHGVACVYPCPHSSIEGPNGAPCHGFDKGDISDEVLATDEIYPCTLMEIVEDDL